MDKNTKLKKVMSANTPWPTPTRTQLDLRPRYWRRNRPTGIQHDGYPDYPGFSGFFGYNGYPGYRYYPGYYGFQGYQPLAPRNSSEKVQTTYRVSSPIISQRSRQWPPEGSVVPGRGFKIDHSHRPGGDTSIKSFYQPLTASQCADTMPHLKYGLFPYKPRVRRRRYDHEAMPSHSSRNLDTYPHLKYGLFPNRVSSPGFPSLNQKKYIRKRAEIKQEAISRGRIGISPVFIYYSRDNKYQRRLSLSEILHVDIRPPKKIKGVHPSLWFG